MTTEQPTELEDIDGFFLRGELDESAVLADRPVGPRLDEETDTLAPPSAAQLARRARLRKLVVAIVAPLGVVSAVLLGPRALSFHVGTGARASSDLPHASAAVAVEPAAPARALANVEVKRVAPVPASPSPTASERALDQPRPAEPPPVAVNSAPAVAQAPKPARVALRAAPREMPPALPRSSLPPDEARSTQVSVTRSQSTGSSDSLPTARFPTSAAN